MHNGWITDCEMLHVCPGYDIRILDENVPFCFLSAGSVPSPKSVASWVLCRGLGKTLDEMTVTIPHDLYVFGSQENSVCDREWVESLRAILKEQTELDYKPVRNAARNKDFSKQKL